jgi:F-type H+-transporting ATPase subunit a
MTPLPSILTLAAENPLDHVVNHAFITVDGWWVWSSHVGNIVLTGLIMALLFPRLARQIAGHGASGNDRFIPRKPGTHLFEVFCTYLRDTVVRPVLGENTDRFMPLLWTFFFFILINNLLGLVPILEVFALAFGLAKPEWSHHAPFGATATGNPYVTGALALIAGAVYIIHGVRSLGVRGFAQHMTGGAPAWLWPIIVPIEVLGTFVIKVGALAIRLFANMTAGHVLVATLLMFVGMSFNALAIWGAGPISLLSIAVLVPIYFLELFVAVLQAFIFMFLTTIFIGIFSAHGHHEPSHDGHGHAHAPAHAH